MRARSRTATTLGASLRTHDQACDTGPGEEHGHLGGGEGGVVPTRLKTTTREPRSPSDDKAGNTVGWLERGCGPAAWQQHGWCQAIKNEIIIRTLLKVLLSLAIIGCLVAQTSLSPLQLCLTSRPANGDGDMGPLCTSPTGRCFLCRRGAVGR